MRACLHDGSRQTRAKTLIARRDDDNNNNNNALKQLTRQRRRRSVRNTRHRRSSFVFERNERKQSFFPVNMVGLCRLKRRVLLRVCVKVKAVRNAVDGANFPKGRGKTLRVSVSSFLRCFRTTVDITKYLRALNTSASGACDLPKR